jgi:hypothetical protein
MILKRVIFIVVFIAVGALEVLLYWNTHLYYMARERIKDNEEKIEVLERANQFYPYNDLIYYELGKANFNLGINNIGEKKLRNFYFQESIQNFIRSIKLNPASPLSHFNFAQSLFYMSHDSSSDLDHYTQYKRAASLTGHHSQIFFEVGQILFSQWPELSEEERDFTLFMLEKIMVRREPEKLLAIMHAWEMNVKDYTVMEKILPKNADVFRLYAKFLGEKFLANRLRLETLAKAEYLELEKAKELHYVGMSEVRYFQIKRALNYFRSSFNILKKINFYQDLTEEKLIEPSEYKSLQKSLYLNMAKCRVEEGASLEEVEDLLHSYLALEDNAVSIGEFESYLKKRGITGEKPDANFDDLKSLFFQTFLSFKQSRYREIMRVGRLLRESFVVIPEGQKEDYMRVLQLIGDSFLKADYPYEAREFYLKALEIEPDNLENLFRIRQYYVRLNEEKSVRKTDESIEKVLAPQGMVLKYFELKKGSRFKRTLPFDGREIVLNLQFMKNWQENAPLMTVIFNGRVVWEDYLKDDFLSIPLETKAGENILAIIPVNKPIEFLKITYR